MKKYMKAFRTLAALLMAGVAFTACSSSDDSIIEQPVQPTEPKTYTMTIKATKATGDDATTRGLYWGDTDKKVLNVNWNGKEKVRVVQDGKVIGTLSAAMSNGENGHKTTLTGTVTGFDNNQAIAFYLLADENGKMDYTGQKGAVLEENGPGNIEENYDFASYELTGNQCFQAFEVNGSTIVPKEGTIIAFASQQAIVRFELLNSSGDNLFVKKLIVTDKNTGKLVQSYDPLTNTKTYGQVAATLQNNNGNVFYVALNFDAASDIRLYALDNSGNLYTYEKSSVTFTKGKYYRVKVKMNTCSNLPLYVATSEDLGKVIGYDGNIYANASAAGDAGTTPAAMIAYVSHPGHGLAIQLFANPNNIGWSDAKTYVEGLPIISGGTWRLPSKEDWQNMFVACAISGDASAGDLMNPINGFWGKITSTGVGWHYGYYWTSTEAGSNAWVVNVTFSDVHLYADFGTLETDYPSNVLGCLAF